MQSSTGVVIDSGSATCRVGLAGSKKPISCFPTLVGKPKHSMGVGAMNKQAYYGKEA